MVDLESGRRSGLLVVSLLAIVAALAACSSSRSRGDGSFSETFIELDRANFKTTRVHAVGQARRQSLFLIPIEGPADVRNAAFKAMKRDAGIEGQPSQFVNVTCEQSERIVIWPFYSEVVCTVSADVVTFDPPRDRRIREE